MHRFKLNRSQSSDAPTLVDENHSKKKSNSDYDGDESRPQDTDEKPWRAGDRFRYPLRKQRDPWHDCHELVKKYDSRMCDEWKEEITNLLVLAGLFSAVVTAFAIESYKWLQPDTGDTSLAVLLHISSQLSADANNATARAPYTPQPFVAPAWALQINIFWFVSLILSLTTAMVGILCLQWLREYEHEVHLSPKEAFALRQMLHEGLTRWHVPKILYALPLILQLALVSFFIGLLYLLWEVHHTLAEVAGAFVGVTLLFVSLTTVLPTLQFLLPLNKNLRVPQCAYKSLQSWAFFRAVATLSWLLTIRIIPDSIRFLKPYILRYWSKRPPHPSHAAEEGHIPSTSAGLTRSTTRRSTRSFGMNITDLAETKISELADNVKKWYFVWWKFEEKMWKIMDWGEFDLYWRAMRDVVPEKHSKHYDTIRGLRWVNKKLPQGMDATYIIHPCLLDLEIPIAIHAIRQLSSADMQPDDEHKNDSLGWFARFYEKTDTESQRIIRLTRQKAESDPLHREMLSLLAIRHLNSGPFLHPFIRNHYMELYTRIRNTAGDDVIPFFEHPLRLPSQMNLELNDVSENVFVEKMFELLNSHVPEETISQILNLLLPRVQDIRLKALQASRDMKDNALQIVEPVAGRSTENSVIEVIGDTEENVLGDYESYDQIVPQLRNAWRLMQPVWSILCQILKSPLPFNKPDDNVRAHILQCSFYVCEELTEYMHLLWDAGDRHHVQECVSGMVLLHHSIGDSKFAKLTDCEDYEKIRNLAQVTMGYMKKDAALKWLWFRTALKDESLRILREFSVGGKGNGAIDREAENVGTKWDDTLRLLKARARVAGQEAVGGDPVQT